jgi:hypothetical protein
VQLAGFLFIFDDETQVLRRCHASFPGPIPGLEVAKDLKDLAGTSRKVLGGGRRLEVDS